MKGVVNIRSLEMYFSCTEMVGLLVWSFNQVHIKSFTSQKLLCRGAVALKELSEE